MNLECYRDTLTDPLDAVGFCSWHIDLIGGFTPSERYQLYSSWDSDVAVFPTEWKNKIHVPNHQAVIDYQPNINPHKAFFIDINHC